MIRTQTFSLLSALTACILTYALTGCSEKDYPDPKDNPDSPLMLSGDWFDDPHAIVFDSLPKIPSRHSVVSDVSPGGKDYKKDSTLYSREGGVNQHNYMVYFNNKYWIMWSNGPAREDRVGQVVKYATSPDGINWTEPQLITPYPHDSDPSSSYYNSRTDKGFRWIARGFWVYHGRLLALTALDEAGDFFGKSLELRAFELDKSTEQWQDAGVIYKNAINNFPPKQLPDGEWLMSRRSYDYKKRGVDFMVGGEKDLTRWNTYPVLGTSTELSAEEPYWWILPDDKGLMALFRDNRKSGYLYRSFSTDNGKTWSKPTQTNFPDAASKFNGVRLTDGRYLLVSNPNPEKRDPLTLSISDDGMVFTKMGYLIGGRHIDYPNIIQHEGYVLIAFAGSAKQKIEVLKVKITDLNALDMSQYTQSIKK